jgi:flotillin
VVLVALIAVIGVWSSRYVKVGPDEVLILSGRKRTIGGVEVGYRVVRNGGTFVWPVLERIGRLSLHAIATTVETNNALTMEGVPLIVHGVAIFKISSDEDGIVRAAERYQGRDRRDIESDVQSVLEGALRGVCGTLTPEEIYRDRQAFQQKIAEHAEPELARLGVTLDTLTLRDIKDAHGYLDALGRKRSAEVVRDARVGEANAVRDAEMAEADARQDAEIRKAEAETRIAQARRDLEVKRAEYEADVNRQGAIAAQAGPRATAEAEQDVARAQAALASERALQRENELRATVIKDAEAAKQRVILDAEAAKQRAILDAEGKAEGLRREAEARQFDLERTGTGQASQEQQTGSAQAEVIKAKLVAEADGLREKAEAMREFTASTMRLEIAKELIATMPRIIEASVQPLAQVDSIRIVDFGGNGNGNGSGGSSPANKLLDISPHAVTKADEVLRSTLGMGLRDLMSGMMDDATADQSAGDSAGSEDKPKKS